MAQHGSLQNLMLSRSSATEPPADLKVGDGMTEVMWTDRHPYTVVEISESRQTVKVQADNYKRTDKNGMSDSQSYEFSPNTDSPIETLRWSKKRGLYTRKGTPFWLGRRCYHDYSF